MAFTYGFYNSLNDDRLYNATQVSELFDGIIRDGVFSSVDEIFATVPGEGLQVIVKTGRAWFNHTWNKNDSAYPLNIDAAHVTLPRCDAVVLEVNEDITARRNRLLVIKGTPASTPAKPTLTNTATLHQHVLAYITLPAGAVAITAGMIDIRVGKTECPFVTGILQTANIDDLFQQWEHNFDMWLADVKVALTGDVATNLLYMIDDLTVKKVDKDAVASEEEAKAMGAQDKWMTPYTTGLLLDPFKYVDQHAWLYCPPSNSTTYTLPLISSGNKGDLVTSEYMSYGPETITTVDATHRIVSYSVINSGGNIYTAKTYSVDPTTGAVTVTGQVTYTPRWDVVQFQEFRVVPGPEGQPGAGWINTGGTSTRIGWPPNNTLAGLFWSTSLTALTTSGGIAYGGAISFNTISGQLGLHVTSYDIYKVTSVTAGAAPSIFFGSTDDMYPQNTDGYFYLGKTQNALAQLTPMVYGSYTGNGAATREIILGFSPRMLMISRAGVLQVIHVRGTVTFPATGFNVSSSYNGSGNKYDYVAWR